MGDAEDGSAAEVPVAHVGGGAGSVLGLVPGARLGVLRRQNTLGTGALAPGAGPVGKPSIDVALERSREALLRDEQGQPLESVWETLETQIGQLAGPGAGLYFVVLRMLAVAMALSGLAAIVFLIVAAASLDPCEMCAYQLYGQGVAAVEACRAECAADPDGVWRDGKGLYSELLFSMSFAAAGRSSAFAWIVFDFAVLMGLFVYLLSMRYQVMASLRQMDATTVSAADYAVVVHPDVFNADMVPGLPGGLPRTHRTQDEALAAFFRHYGDVVRCTVPFDYGEVLLADRERVEVKLELDELYAQRQSLAQKAAAGEDVSRATARVDASIQEYGARVAELGRVVSRETQFEFVNTGYAFVQFDSEESRAACLRDLNRGFRRRWADWLFCAPPPPEFEDPADSIRYRLAVEPAPEPEDIAWENLHVQGAYYWYRQLFANLLVGLLIALGALVQAALQSAKDSVYEQSSLGVTVGYDGAALTGAVFVAAIFVNLINSAIVACFRTVSKWERHHTNTELMNALVVRLAAAQLINSALVPVLASMWRMWVAQDSSYTFDDWFIRGGLLEQLMYIQLINIAGQDLPVLLNLEYLYARYFTAPKAATQRKMDAILEPLVFDLGESYAKAIKTIGLGVLLGPILPMSYCIAAVGLAISYATDKYVLLRLRKAPHFVTTHITAATVLKAVRVILVLRVFLNRFWWHLVAYEHTVDNGDTVFSLNVACCCVFWVLPMKAFLNMIGIKMLESRGRDRGTNGLRCCQAQALAIASQGAFKPLRIYRPAVAHGVLPNYAWDALASPDEPWRATHGPMPGQMEGTHPSERPEDARVDIDTLVAEYARKSSEAGAPGKGEQRAQPMEEACKEVPRENVPLPPGWLVMPATSGLRNAPFRRDERMLEATADAHRDAAASTSGERPQYDMQGTLVRDLPSESPTAPVNVPRTPLDVPHRLPSYTERTPPLLHRSLTNTSTSSIEWAPPHLVQCPQCGTVVESVSALWRCPVCFTVNQG